MVNPEPVHLRHLLISASAGSGKTYQLVRRYVHLLGLNQPPDGIAAMTFTRKAAGEFFTRILRQLAELAEQPDGREKYLADLSPPLSASTDFGQLLRRLTCRMHRLRLGTLDSFFAGMASCFPLELGLPAGARVMDEVESRQARAEALDGLLERLHDPAHATDLKLLLEAFKQATFGAEEKSVEESLQKWAETGLAIWEDCIETGECGFRGWGDLGQILPIAPSGVLPSIDDAIAAVRAAFKPVNAAGQKLLDETLQAARDTVPGLTLPEPVVKLFKDKGKLLENLSKLREGRGELMWMRQLMPLSAEAAAAWLQLAQTLLARELAVRAERTRGLARVTAMYAAEYAHRVQSRGRLSFADVQRVLARAAREQCQWLSGGGELWFRLDARYQQWLLDEFQDTSRVQWQVLHTFVDEVMQDAEGVRSFFAVGDPKQSIYLWRQADPHLFEDILRLYPQNGEQGLHCEPLNCSYRSAQVVLDAINQVFDPERLAAVMPPGSTDGFRFKEHKAAYPEITGAVALLSPAKAGDGEDELAPVDIAAALLREIQPLRRGLTCAVLVRQNSEVRFFTEELRVATGLAVVCEADEHPALDNAVTLALLSLLTLAAHPSDTQALEHLRMTPLWPVIQDGDGKGWRYRAAEIQSCVMERGFAVCLKTWTDAARRACPGLDSFHALRLAQLIDLAADFDATGSRDIDAFVETAREYPLRRRGAARAVQVMTIHAAKGLEFDMVILPTLDGDAMDHVKRTDLLVHREEHGVRWVLQSPPSVLIPLEPTLHQQMVETERRTAFESLCRLYVAMTRAKRGLFLIAKRPPAKPTALKECLLLRRMLGTDPVEIRIDGSPVLVEWQTGVPRWFEETPLSEPEAPLPAEPAREPLGAILRRRQPMPRRRTPSGEEAFHVKGSVLFTAGRETGRRTGSLVHALLEQVEWWQPGAAMDGIRTRWQAAGLVAKDGDEGVADAMAQAERVLRSVDCAAAFQPLSPHAEVWRERAFDLVLDDEWISGVVDRVLIDRDAEGRITAAWLVDFKTDDIEADGALVAKLAGYAPQIALYRTALHRLTGLPEASIRGSLLFTRQPRLVAV